MTFEMSMLGVKLMTLILLSAVPVAAVLAWFVTRDQRREKRAWEQFERDMAAKHDKRGRQ